MKSQTYSFLFIFFISHFLCHRGLAENFVFESGEYEVLRNIAQDIARPYKAGTAYFVGLGRSPAPVAAYFQEAGLGEATTLPATKLKWLSPDRLEESHREAIYQHFSRHLDFEKIGKDTTLVVFDHTESGLGLQNGGKLLRDYLASKNRYNPVVTVSISYEGLGAQKGEDLADRQVTYNSPGQLKRFAQERYDKYAEFGQAMLMDPEANYSQEARPEYQQLRSAFRKKIVQPQRSGSVTWGAAIDFCDRILMAVGLRR